MLVAEDPDKLLPLTPAVLHILMSLAEGEKHGYAVMQSVAEQSGGRLRMGPGTLYGSIKRMLASGLIAESQEAAEPVPADERRRYYKLTALGARTFKAELERLDQILKVPAARHVLAEVRP